MSGPCGDHYALHGSSARYVAPIDRTQKWQAVHGEAVVEGARGLHATADERRPWICARAGRPVNVKTNTVRKGNSLHAPISQRDIPRTPCF